MFKPGDKVVCIDTWYAERYLEYNREYTIEFVYNDVSNVTLMEISSNWNADRFELLSTHNYKKDFEELLA